MNFRNFIRIIMNYGFYLDRQEGSHRIYKNDEGEITRVVVVAFHRENDEIRAGTLAAMIRQTGMNKKLFR